MKPLLLLLTLLLGVWSLPLPAQDAPADGASDPTRLFAVAHMKRLESDKLRKEGNLQGAYLSLKEAVEMYQDIGKKFPEWNSQMVAYRTSQTKEELLALDKVLKDSGIAPPTGEESNKTAEDLNGEEVRAPDPQDIIPPEQVPGLPDIGKAMSALQYLGQEFQAMQDAYGGLFNENKQLQDRFSTMEKEYHEVAGRVMLAEKQAKTAEEKLAEIGAEREADKKKAAEELSALKTEWEEIKKDLETMKAEKAKMLAELPDLAKKYDVQTQELKKAKAELEAAKKREADMNSAAGQGGVQQLVEAKNQLEMDLAAANTKITELEAAGVAKDKEIASLKADLEKADKQITALKNENHDAKMKVAELTDNLRVAKAEMEKLQNSKSADPLLKEENDVLQRFLMSEIRRQSRLQESRNILMAELKKVEGVKDDLLDRVNQATTMVAVPENIRKLLRVPVGEEPLPMADSGIQTTLVAKRSSSPAAKLEEAMPTPVGQDAKDLLVKARASFDAGKFSEAETLYLDYLRGDPKNSEVLSSLGAVQVRLKKDADAEVHLQKAVTYDDKNAFAHFMLGVLQFNEGNVKEADAQLTQAVNLEPSNSKAHHYLGIAASRQNDYKRAESELATAVSLDPNYASAQFNLAVLYGTMPEKNWDKSREHYTLAVERGAKRDRELEGLLDSHFPDFSKTMEANVTSANP